MSPCAVRAGLYIFFIVKGLVNARIQSVVDQNRFFVTVVTRQLAWKTRRAKLTPAPVWKSMVTFYYLRSGSTAIVVIK